MAEHCIHNQLFPSDHPALKAAYLCDCETMLSDDETGSFIQSPLAKLQLPTRMETVKRTTSARRLQKRRKLRHIFPRPIFERAGEWHLSQAKIQVNGLSGMPRKICEVPNVPEGCAPSEHLKILQGAGYKVVKQDR
jgi:hypothetical protein